MRAQEAALQSESELQDDALLLPRAYLKINDAQLAL